MGNVIWVVCVLFDNFIVVDGYYVDEVFFRVLSGDILLYFVVEYYFGKLYKCGFLIEMYIIFIVGVFVGEYV